MDPQQSLQRGKTKFAESDLYEPIYEYLTRQGFTVRSEVRDCDITAVKGDELIIIELKKHFNVELLVQAAQRQKITSGVYVALPKPNKTMGSAKWKANLHLIKRLELGLILVSLNSIPPKVDVVFHPLPFEDKKSQGRKKGILMEIEGRCIDSNRGGSSRQKIMTAYRENAIYIACCLEKVERLTPAQLRALGTGPKTLSILNKNFYGWFHRIARGVYMLSSEGRGALEDYPDVARYYRNKLKEQVEGKNSEE